MKSILTLNQTDLVWKQPKFSKEYFILEADSQIIAELWWPKWLSNEASARTVDESWKFDRQGCWRDQIVIYQKDSRNPTAHLVLDGLNDSELLLPGGRAYTWYRTRAIDEAWAVSLVDDQLIFEIELGMHWFKRRAWINVEQSQFKNSDLGLLLCLGFYLAVCLDQDSAAVAAAVAGGTVAAVG